MYQNQQKVILSQSMCWWCHSRWNIDLASPWWLCDLTTLWLYDDLPRVCLTDIQIVPSSQTLHYFPLHHHQLLYHRNICIHKSILPCSVFREIIMHLDMYFLSERHQELYKILPWPSKGIKFWTKVTLLVQYMFSLLVLIINISVCFNYDTWG